MRTCFSFLLLLLLHNGAQAQKTGFFIGASGDVGFGPNINVYYGPGFTAYLMPGVTAGFVVKPNLEVGSGVGVSYFSYNIYNGEYQVGTQSLQYTEIPFFVRFMPERRKRHTGSRPIKYRSPHSRPPRPSWPSREGGAPAAHLYVEGGFMTGILSRAHWNALNSNQINHKTVSEDNRNDFHALTAKPMIGIGGIFGGDARANFILGIRFSTSLRGEHISGTQGISQSISLTAFSLTLGVQVHLGQ